MFNYRGTGKENVDCIHKEILCICEKMKLGPLQKKMGAT